MGQAKKRGTRDQRVTQAKDRRHQAQAHRQAVALAYQKRLAEDPAFAAEVRRRQHNVALFSALAGLAGLASRRV